MATTAATITSDVLTAAERAGTFHTLLAAVRAANLEETLRQPGPFTIFAPTDEAFAKLPPGTWAALLQDPERLRGVLLLHVVKGRLPARVIAKLPRVLSAHGLPLSVVETRNGVQIHGAKILTTDIEASNGVIHIIDRVLFASALYR